MKKAKITNEIIKMTKLWYEYVSMDHHKDNDCHWYITKTFSYGKSPIWTVSHYGYIYEGKELNATSYIDALKKLRSLITTAFSKELDWALDVSKNYSDWDEYQIKKAKYAIKYFSKYNG